MQVQDKSYAIAIVVVLGICCLGMYVAVSGYLNSNPSGFPLIAPGIQATPVFVAMSTDTPVPTKPPSTLPGVSTLAPVPSPLGVLQTITAAATIIVPTQPPPPTPKPTASPTTATSPGMPSCIGFAFCPRGGLPDYDLAPGGQGDCPRNYLWGRVVGLDGRGLRDRRIRFINPLGETDWVTTKAPPDPEGRYDIPSVQTGSPWVIWLLGPSGGDASPRVRIVTQAYIGVGNCPTRVDFVQQQ